ncbi:hypothetical protein [Bacillus thuringiensis]|uniref:hypothetical protein n=1 Tax=Bacillus thuringiensis TaxID=1428 RepID=UPI0020D284D8|nr:hypothetical protein [Bacillus thuringiensis]
MTALNKILFKLLYGNIVRTYSDRYLGLEDEARDYEGERLSIRIDVDDMEAEVMNNKLIAEKWLEVAEKMERLSTLNSPNLPQHEKELFIKSHALLSNSAKMEANINLLEMEKVVADSRNDLKLKKELDLKKKEQEELSAKMLKEYRNILDSLLK